MIIAVKLAFDEMGALRLLNWLAEENAVIHQEKPSLPLLYDSGVVYRRETDETWCDYINMLLQGHEDCDGLAAARAGELLARGWQAMRPSEPGYEIARQFRPASIKAEVMLKTSGSSDGEGLYHCIVHYRLGNQWFRDDPSARLGMYGTIPSATRARWARRFTDKRWRTQ